MRPKSSAPVKPRKRHGPGLAIDLDLGDIAAGGIGEVRRVVEGGLVEAGLQRLDGKIVRHVGREGDLREGRRAVGAGHRELAVGELDIRLGRLEHMGGDLLALVDDLVHGLDQRGAAHGQRARGIGPHAERDPAGVAVHDIDLVEGKAEAVRHELGEGRLMALAMAVRPGEDGDAAGRVHAHLGGLVEAGARAELAGHHRGRHGAGLDIGGDADAAQLAARRRFLAALLEARVVGGLEAMSSVLK